MPILAWNFEGTTTDYISGLTGTTLGTVNYVTGKYSQALQIVNTSGTSASSNNVSYSGLSLNSGTGFTVTVWARIDTYQGASIQGTVIGLRGYPNAAPATVNYFNLWQQSGGGVWGFYGQNGVTAGSNYQPQRFSTITPVIGTWYHLALAVNSSTFTFYLNGSQVGATVPVGNAFTINQMFLGRSGQLNGQALIGAEDDLRVYDTTLNAGQIQTIYQGQGIQSRGLFLNSIGTTASQGWHT